MLKVSAVLFICFALTNAKLWDSFLGHKTEESKVEKKAEAVKTNEHHRAKRQVPFGFGLDTSFMDYAAYDYYDWVCSGGACQLCDVLTGACCVPNGNNNCFLPDSCANNPCLSGGTCVTTRTIDNQPDFVCVCQRGLTGKYCQLIDEFTPPIMAPMPIPIGGVAGVAGGVPPPAGGAAPAPAPAGQQQPVQQQQPAAQQSYGNSGRGAMLGMSTFQQGGQASAQQGAAAGAAGAAAAGGAAAGGFGGMGMGGLGGMGMGGLGGMGMGGMGGLGGMGGFGGMGGMGMGGLGGGMGAAGAAGSMGAGMGGLGGMGMGGMGGLGGMGGMSGLGGMGGMSGMGGMGGMSGLGGMGGMGGMMGMGNSAGTAAATQQGRK